MKKRISLLLCALMLLLGVQSACAEMKLTATTIIKNVTVNRLTHQGNMTSNPLEGLSKPCTETISKSAAEALLGHPRPRTPGSVSNAVITDISAKDDSDNPVTAEDDEVLSVTIPMGELAPRGTMVSNVQVLHGLALDVKQYTWKELPAALTNGTPDVGFIPLDTSGTLTASATTSSSPDLNACTIKNAIPQNASAFVDSDLYLTLVTDSFSPFIIVWDEIPLYSDVPQTGDSSASLAPWLLLLSGACALLVLRRRLRRA